MYKSIIRILDRIGEYLNNKNPHLYDDPYGGAWPGSVTFREDIDKSENEDKE